MPVKSILDHLRYYFPFGFINGNYTKGPASIKTRWYAVCSQHSSRSACELAKVCHPLPFGPFSLNCLQEIKQLLYEGLNEVWFIMGDLHVTGRFAKMCIQLWYFCRFRNKESNIWVRIFSDFSISAVLSPITFASRINRTCCFFLLMSLRYRSHIITFKSPQIVL